MRDVFFSDEFFESCVDGSEASIVSDLEEGFRTICFREDGFGVRDVNSQWFFAEDVFAGIERSECERNVLRVWGRDVNGVATLDYFGRTSSNLSVVRACEFFRALTVHVVNRCQLHPFITREYPRMDAADITGANYPDF